MHQGWASHPASWVRGPESEEQTIDLDHVNVTLADLLRFITS